MHIKTYSILLGAMLCPGLVMAQAADQNQAAPANAQTQQGQQHRAPNPDKQAQHLGKKLGLSRDQVQQIKPILADRQQQVQSLRADTTLAPQDRRAKMQSIMRDSKTKIEAVLNDTQKQQFEQMVAQRQEHHHAQQPQGQ